MVPVQTSAYVEKFAAGSWNLRVEGVYTDTVNRNYLIMVSFGSDVEASRFDWSDDGGVNWGGVNISITNAIPYSLNHGLSIIWSPGTYLPNLVSGDRFRFHIERPYRPALAIDLNRENTIRSAAISVGGTWIVTFPFAVNTTPDTLLLFDHNIPSNATIRLQGSTTSNFAATPLNNVINWTANKIRYAVPTGATRTYPYWRLHITVVSAVSYIEMSGLYLGAEIAFTREFDAGFRKSLTLLGGSEASILARGQGRYGIQPQRYELTFGHRAPADDLTKFDTLWALTHPTSGSMRPFYLYMDSVATLPIFELFHLEGDLTEAHDFLERSTPSMSLIQVVRTAA
jgi:hypothetical protein